MLFVFWCMLRRIHDLQTYWVNSVDQSVTRIIPIHLKFFFIVIDDLRAAYIIPVWIRWNRKPDEVFNGLIGKRRVFHIRISGGETKAFQKHNIDLASLG